MALPSFKIENDELIVEGNFEFIVEGTETESNDTLITMKFKVSNETANNFSETITEDDAIEALAEKLKQDLKKFSKRGKYKNNKKI